VDFGTVIILPKKENDLSKIEEKLDNSFLERIMSGLHPLPAEQFLLDMKLPRFIVGKNHVEVVSAVQSNGKRLTCKAVSSTSFEISEQGIKTFNTDHYFFPPNYAELHRYHPEEIVIFHATRPFLFCVVLNIRNSQTKSFISASSNSLMSWDACGPKYA
jgi:hypothetical protein